MLSRVQELNQAYILNKLNPKNLYPSQKVLRELERINRVSKNNNRIHFRLQKADIMHLVETSISEDEDEYAFILGEYKKDSLRMAKETELPYTTTQQNLNMLKS